MLLTKNYLPIPSICEHWFNSLPLEDVRIHQGLLARDLVALEGFLHILVPFHPVVCRAFAVGLAVGGVSLCVRPAASLGVEMDFSCRPVVIRAKVGAFVPFVPICEDLLCLGALAGEEIECPGLRHGGHDGGCEDGGDFHDELLGVGVELQGAVVVVEGDESSSIFQCVERPLILNLRGIF